LRRLPNRIGRAELLVLHRMQIPQPFDALGINMISGLAQEHAGEPTARSPVAETVELVKPLHAQWPSSDESRASR
jgi:hypothetical protein